MRKFAKRVSALALVCVGAFAFVLIENELHGAAAFFECIILAALVD